MSAEVIERPQLSPINVSKNIARAVGHVLEKGGIGLGAIFGAGLIEQIIFGVLGIGSAPVLGTLALATAACLAFYLAGNAILTNT
jgi:hypothetical protein